MQRIVLLFVFVKPVVKSPPSVYSLIHATLLWDTGPRQSEGDVGRGDYGRLGGLLHVGLLQ